MKLDLPDESQAIDENLRKDLDLISEKLKLKNNSINTENTELTPRSRTLADRFQV